MKNYIVHADTKSPEIVFLTTGVCMISGSSRPENSVSFYKPFIAWINDYKKTSPAKIDLTLDLDYVNSSSIKVMMDILKLLKEIASKKSFTITWLYEEEDLDALDLGKVLEKNLGVDFNYVLK